MEYVQLTMSDYLQSKEEIKQNLGGIVKSFVRIGWQLTRINASEAYRHDGYKSIVEFAKAEYGMNSSGVSRFMDVYEKYSVEGDTPELQERYKDFNFSQLSEMLQISEEDRGMFLPEAKRESIRDFKNYNKENENNPDNLLNWMKEPEDLIGKAIMEFYKLNKEILNELYGSTAYTSGDLKTMTEIVNPSGNKHFRYKTIFIMMYEFEKGLMINEFGKGQSDMTWEKFFSITQSIFGEVAAGDRTWEACFAPAQELADEQIPGQDNILNHPELCPNEPVTDKTTVQGNDAIEPIAMPEPEIAPAQIPAENTQEEFEPQPENMSSICYSCSHWSDCNMKSNTVTDCNEYNCKNQMTEEQKYEMEQAAIDRETKRKLEERAQEERLSHLPSEEGQQVHQIRLASTYFADMAAGVKSFDLRKKDKHFKVGDILEYLEFTEGRNTGRLIRAEVTYILEDYTGLEDGFCIMAIKILDVLQ